jgi:hypothetical protein
MWLVTGTRCQKCRIQDGTYRNVIGESYIKIPVPYLKAFIKTPDMQSKWKNYFNDFVIVKKSSSDCVKLETFPPLRVPVITLTKCIVLGTKQLTFKFRPSCISKQTVGRDNPTGNQSVVCYSSGVEINDLHIFC